MWLCVCFHCEFCRVNVWRYSGGTRGRSASLQKWCILTRPRNKTSPKHTLLFLWSTSQRLWVHLSLQLIRHLQRCRKQTRIGMVSIPFPERDTHFPVPFPSLFSFFPLLPPSLAFPFFPSLFPFPFTNPCPFPSLHPSLSLRSRTPWIQLESLGECSELPQRGLGQGPSINRCWCILAFLTSGGNNFNDFPENQLPKFQQIGMVAATPAIPLSAPLGTYCRLTKWIQHWHKCLHSWVE